MKIFITGATGFLGQYLVRELSPKCESLFVLTRNSNFMGFGDLANVHLVTGDITKLEIIDDVDLRDQIINECDFAVHAAALYNLSAGHAESYLHNVCGTQNMLNFSKKIKNLKALYYISTIAVGDDQSIILDEEKLPQRKKFSDFYSETKYSAEKIVRESSEKLPIRIIRPGIIIGDSQTGKMDKVDGPYYFIEAMKKYSKFLKPLKILPLSFIPNTKIPLIPVDHCAQFISLLIERDLASPELKTYHIISDEIPTVQEFLSDMNEAFGLKTKYIPVFKNPIHNTLLKLMGIPEEVIPFMFSKLSYDKAQTIEAIPELRESKYSSYKNILFGK
jgi:nucleoside-diphosphate-sugar epimerase